MRNALNLRFCFLVTFLLFIPLMYALPPEGITIKGRVTDETLKEGVPGANVLSLIHISEPTRPY